MPLKLEHLAGDLSKRLQPAYLIAGDETLLVEESCDQVLKAAQAAGFTERQVLFVESGFNWHELLEQSQSLSLFAERKVIDLRIPAGKIDRVGSEVLRQYLEAPSDDNLLLVRMPRLDRNQRSSAWFKALDKTGAVILIWDLTGREYLQFLNQRLQAAGLRLERDALELLAQLTEGNLLAAVQEIRKLELLELPQPVTIDALSRALEDSSSHTAFELIDAVYAGHLARIVRVLDSLRSEGESPVGIVALFASQVRSLRGGGGWMPRERQRAAQDFMRRIPSIDAVLAECSLVDQQAKGQLLGDPWQSLSDLFLRLAGNRQLSLPSERIGVLQRH